LVDGLAGVGKIALSVRATLNDPTDGAMATIDVPAVGRLQLTAEAER
jgi:hypothetical protein